ncbi:hypothetical protein DXG01_011829 [Tephrocybe rancida]|nr:hypothetical protein DXG01_011829 [Tephrocybe rancida]
MPIKQRKETQDDRFYAPMERDIVTPIQRAERVLARPFIIFIQEPMLIALTAYISFVYGCLYLLFQAYPVVFTEGHNFSAGMSSLMFIPIPIGGTAAVILYVLIYNPKYERLAEKFSPNTVPPETRLEIALIAGPLFSISFFWFAWTSFPSISFWAPMSSGLLMGFAICWIFLSLINYIVDAYLPVAASAMASNTVIRSLCGFAFPLFANKMYAALGPRWASSLLGFVALAMVPIPLVLQRYGPGLRQKSKYAPSKDLVTLEENSGDP